MQLKSFDRRSLAWKSPTERDAADDQVRLLSIDKTLLTMPGIKRFWSRLCIRVPQQAYSTDIPLIRRSR
jgi:hypothetical protein